jgi:hypothetical protein
VQQLQSCLNQNIFSAPGIQYVAATRNFTRNEIRYYNQSFRDSIKLLQQCLRSVYPDKTFYPVKLNRTNQQAVAEIWIYDSTAAPRIGGPDYVFRSLKEALAADPNEVYKLDLSNQRYDYFEMSKFPNLKEINIRNSGATSQEIEALEDYMKQNEGKVISDPLMTRGVQVSIDNSTGKIGAFVQNNAGEQFAICTVPDNFNFKDRNVYTISRGERVRVGTISGQSKEMPLILLVKLSGARGENSFTGTYSSRTTGVIRGVRNPEPKVQVDLYDPKRVGRGGDPIPVSGTITQVNYSGSINISPENNLPFSNAFTTDISEAAGLSGSLLTDKDGYALGILIAGDGKQTIFIPIQRILDEFYVRIVYAAPAAAK